MPWQDGFETCSACSRVMLQPVGMHFVGLGKFCEKMVAEKYGEGIEGIEGIHSIHSIYIFDLIEYSNVHTILI